MKRFSLTMLMVLACAVTYSQFSIGPKVGYINSTVVGDEAESWDCRSGLLVGVMTRFSLGDQFSLQPELHYAQQGADYKDEFSDGMSSFEYTGTVKLDYINIPVMAQYEAFPGFTIEAGPQLGFLVSAKDEYDFDGESGEDDVKDLVKGVDFAMGLGLGYTFGNGINLAARYNFGLTDFIDDEELSDMGAKWRNNALQVSVGYFFKLPGQGGDSSD